MHRWYYRVAKCRWNITLFVWCHKTFMHLYHLALYVRWFNELKCVLERVGIYYPMQNNIDNNNRYNVFQEPCCTFIFKLCCSRLGLKSSIVVCGILLCIANSYIPIIHKCIFMLFTQYSTTVMWRLIKIIFHVLTSLKLVGLICQNAIKWQLLLIIQNTYLLYCSC